MKSDECSKWVPLENFSKKELEKWMEEARERTENSISEKLKRKFLSVLRLIQRFFSSFLP